MQATEQATTENTMKISTPLSFTETGVTGRPEDIGKGEADESGVGVGLVKAVPPP